MPIQNKLISKGYRQELNTIIKIYTKESKYGGNKNSFDFKLAIFYNIYGCTDVLYKAKAKVFFIMLKGLALNFFYLNNTINKLSFQDICSTIQTYFKGLKYKRGVLVYWNAISLKSIMDKSEGKLTADYLQLLFNKLHHLQYRLNINLYTNVFIYNKLIVAYQDVLLYQYTYYKPVPTIAGLINDLQLLITIQEKLYLAKLSAFFTDCCYHHN